MLFNFQSNSLLKRSAVLLWAPVMLLSVLAWSTTDEAVEQLMADYAALQSAVEDYRAQRDTGLEGTEAADYAAYVASLQRRVFEDCRNVMLSGASIMQDLPCPVVIPAVTQSADISTETEQTREEQLAALDAMLNTGLGDYDEKLLREQERIKATAPYSTASQGGQGGGQGGNGSAGGSGDAGEGEGEAQDSPGSGGGQGQAGGSGQQPADGSEDAGAGPGSGTSRQEQPADIPDGNDDDVVARQLREAAEKETDPELKAKLWEEYRRYKRGTD